MIILMRASDLNFTSTLHQHIINILFIVLKWETNFTCRTKNSVAEGLLSAGRDQASKTSTGILEVDYEGAFAQEGAADPVPVLSRMVEATASTLERLVLNNCGLRGELPGAVLSLLRLQVLELGDNELVSVPVGLGLLSALTELRLGKNHL